MEKIKNKLHRLLFPKEHRALRVALEVSGTYWLKSPSFEKREVGDDIHTKIIRALK